VIRAALALALTVWLLPNLALAQPANGCATCIVAAACEPRRDSCIAECRARLFSIDPKRGSCIDDCSTKADRCTQAAVSSCRARNLCR